MRQHVCLIILFLSCNGMLGTIYAQYNFNVIRTFGEISHEVVFASYNSDGSYIITAGSDSSLIIWNADRRTIYRTLAGLKGRPNTAVFSDDNEYVFSGGRDNQVTMWDLGAMPPKIMKTYEGFNGPVKSIDVSPDGKYLAAGSSGGTVKVWDLLSTNLIYDLKGHHKNMDVNSVAFSPDNKFLASGSAEGEIILWNIEKGIMTGSQTAQEKGVHHITFSSDGKFLGSCGYSSEIIIWQVPGFSNKTILKGHKDWVQTIDFSPDSKSLISGGRDEIIILWDAAAGKLLHKSEKQGHIIISLDFSPTQPCFISSSYKSEDIETWALSGLDEAQWQKHAETERKSKVTDNSITENQRQITQETVKNIIPPTENLTQKISMIEIFSPVSVQGRIVHDKNNITLIGRASDKDGINTFLINRDIVKLSDAGVFQFNVSLSKGENFFDLVAINSKGKMNELKLVVNCTADNANDPGVYVPEISKGKYFALLIGINEYEDPEITDLSNPVSDAESLYNVLLAKYTFEKENMLLLKNPAQGEIIQTLDELSRKLTSNDNLLIFYAGHGRWDEKGNVGYWFPSDASKNNSVNWFRNSTLRDYLGSISTKHTLLIADACFSGAIFKSRAAFTETPQGIEKLYELPSRKAMTSGILQEVPDESVFIKYLVKRLDENEDQFLTSELLFSSFKTAVMNNSSNVPQYGVIQNVGDEGGDFIFIKK